jgi:hypothetical protein
VEFNTGMAFMSMSGLKCDKTDEKKQTPWPESASELYRTSDHRLSSKLVPTFVDRGVLRGQHGESLMTVILVF